MNILQRGSYYQKITLTAGLILFAFALTHFLNTAVGLVHIETMHKVQEWRTFVTRSWPGTIILGGALVTHIALVLWKLANRATLRLPVWELIQISFGLLIPFLLFPHIVNTRVASNAFNVETNYLYELARLWPNSAILQSTLLLVVWIHGCIGIHYWLRVNDWYRTAQPVLLFLAITIPLSALAGFMITGRAVATLIENPELFANVKVVTRWPDADQGAMLAWYRDMVRFGFAILLSLIASYFMLVYFSRISSAKVSVRYLGGPTITTQQGPSLLEISRMNHIPHASICGGRARCSTCRVRIEVGAEHLPQPGEDEAFTLKSIDAPENVRLACQIHPKSSMTISRLLRPDSTGPDAADLEETDSAGVEKELVALFLDLREFTKMTENRLPYDTVYILNEFFAAAGTAINLHGGWVDKVMGDGLLAIFGQRNGVDIGCRQALRAARDIDLSLDHVNAKLEGEVKGTLRVGMGIHAGPMLVGRIGFGEAVDMTVIGDTVNIASRLEGLAKEKNFQIVLSGGVAKKIGLQESDGQPTTIRIRGSSEPLQVIGIGRGRDLPVRILAMTDEEQEQSAARKKELDNAAQE